MKRFSFALLFAVAMASSVHGQTVIVNEAFDSYADEAALHAVWAGLVGTPPGTGTPADVETRFELMTEPAAAEGDYNDNGVVDAADYVAWRNAAPTDTLPNDPTPGTVDSSDYTLWRAHFGMMGSGGSGNKYVTHLKNQLSPNTVPDGDIVYQPPLDPNFQPDFSIFPSDGLEPIVLRGDIYGEDSLLQRNTIGLRSFFEAATANIFEMGFNNGTGAQGALAATHPEWGVASGPNADCVAAPSQACAGFAVRVQLFSSIPGPNPDWQFFKFDPSWDTNGNGLVNEAEVFAHLGGPTWNRYEATFTADPDTDAVDIVITLDLNRDGINNATGDPGVDATITYNDLVGVTQAGFNQLRLGGPSALYTTSAVRFDNIYLSGPQVAPAGVGALAAAPEPSAIGMAMMAAIGGLFSGMRRR